MAAGTCARQSATPLSKVARSSLKMPMFIVASAIDSTQLAPPPVHPLITCGRNAFFSMVENWLTFNVG